MNETEDRWKKLEEIVRRVVREELAGLKKQPKISMVNGKFVGIGQERMEAWAAAYPAVDLEAEIKKAAAWIVSNPTGTPKDFARYLNGWLSRTQDRAAIRSIPTERKTEIPMKLCAYCDKVATGSTEGRWHCDAHSRNAMDRDPIPRMRGIEAKPVAGA